MLAVESSLLAMYEALAAGVAGAGAAAAGGVVGPSPTIDKQPSQHDVVVGSVAIVLPVSSSWKVQPVAISSTARCSQQQRRTARAGPDSLVSSSLRTACAAWAV